MIYDIAHLRGMAQVEMDALFTAREAGPIPEGEPDSTPITPADTVFTLKIGSISLHGAPWYLCLNLAH